ncbi:hypothetical protein EK0264_17120 [Epidermidibacterium keratini]|uniref:DUF3137 domain-containing protein n=1 Tax=Epidermidibacterium keratini TaxID=1891644 RepID=A0A7L4YSS6_9ACTN|nr:hypothetical protein [Epidermidibacterium keratini]QHC01829.1 hypothetical protein EK0264_17120 [Epidermidibacterium keratini]
MNQPPTPTEPSKPNASPRLVRSAKLGCGAMVLGIVIAVVAWIFQASSGQKTTTTEGIGLAGIALAAGGLIVAALMGVIIRRRGLRGFAAFDNEFQSIPPDIPAARAILMAWLGPATLAPYPSRVVASLRIPARGRDTSLLVNVPKIAYTTRDNRNVEPTVAVSWLVTDTPLPRLLVTPDIRGQSAIRGADADIEHEEFNRRFRVDWSRPGATVTQGPAYADFARYASAMLHPRAAACLTKLPAGRTFVVTDRLIGVVGIVLPDRDVLVRCADVLVEFASLIPPHVKRRWGGNTDYRPRDT